MISKPARNLNVPMVDLRSVMRSPENEDWEEVEGG